MTPKEFDGEDVEDGAPGGHQFHARTTTDDDGTMECTIYPAEASDDRRTTRWITAEEGSYVELARMR